MSDPRSGREILSGVSFRIAAGEALAIVGPNGAGKTSLLRALVRDWKPRHGRIWIEGKAVDELDERALSRQIGYLPQRFRLFGGSIAQNICRFDSIEAKAVIAAARDAGVHDEIILMPDGYETRVGARGMILSTGQEQRIALAKALYRDPLLVVLDEPGSSLDNNGRDALAAAITRLKARRAVVVVASNNVSIVANCDKVLLLNQGKVAVYGDRDEVMRDGMPVRTGELSRR
ncbi:hypothetical protein BST63_16420 [Bradyrhizobium canariense]|uniref:ABC transporter domain-containing protein n=1 Tax=Bradyrhizobium canariense TaxID=255045 RepID=A0ABX3X344_9BRAD|nr:ATP-binding cassette domain-containing protein [Bradyrhizobium canariense]OSJ13531.1 hypothetical protein BSR47_20965 [Bradyrhizobium canariense]OSJ28745.1 hypothetical protein BST63_16420 [Bradyrhizobium canariense]